MKGIPRPSSGNVTLMKGVEEWRLGETECWERKRTNPSWEPKGNAKIVPGGAGQARGLFLRKRLSSGCERVSFIEQGKGGIRDPSER